VAGGFSGKHGLMSLVCFGETGGECRFESCPVAEGGEGMNREKLEKIKLKIELIKAKVDLIVLEQQYAPYIAQEREYIKKLKKDMDVIMKELLEEVKDE